MPFCQFCRQNVEDPCFKPAEAAMRCEVNASVALNTVPAPTPISEAQKATYDPLPPDLQMQPQALIGHQPYHEPPDWSKMPPVTYTPPVPQPGKFHFDENLLALLLEACTTKDQTTAIEAAWKKAQEIADEFEVVMKPTLKRKPKE